jgi:sulfonate transport system permease protein
VTEVLSTTLPRQVRSRSATASWPRGLVLPIVLLLGWIYGVHHGWLSGPLAVLPERIALAPFDDPAARELWFAIAASMLRYAGGVGIGVIAGLAFGIAMGLSPLVERAGGGSFHALRQITLFAWIPLLTAWFGNGEASKIVYIALSAFFPIALNTANGLRDVPLAYREVARVLGLSRRQKIRRVLLPAAMPALLIGVEIALISAWIGTVGAEYAIGNGRGIGTFVAEGREQFRMDIVIVGVGALALAGYLATRLCRKLLFRALTRAAGVS